MSGVALNYEQTAEILTRSQLLMRDPVSKFMPDANEGVCSHTQPDTESVETPPVAADRQFSDASD